MHVGVLGPLELRGDDGEPIEVGGRRQRELLAILAIRAGDPVSTDRLIDELWREHPPQDPANALQLAVSKLRRSIGGHRVTTGPAGYALAVDRGRVDGHRFEQLVEESHEARRDGRTADALAALDQALALWRGEVLADLDLPMARHAATRWEEERATAREDRFELLLADGRAPALVAELEAAVEADPYRERLAGQLMLALARSGRQAEALRAGARLRARLAEELGIDPGPEVQAIEHQILTQQVATTPAGRTNLQPARTSLVGRADEVATVDDALSRSRLVTLVGPGGVGKTRVAMTVSAGRVPATPGGVWFAPLDTVEDPEGVLAVVAAAAGLTPTDGLAQPGGSGLALVERIAEVLRLAPALLVLDNCEHVIDVVAALADQLLAAAPHLRVLATSREALRAPGEVVRPLGPLPDEDATALFLDRARAVAPGFDPGDGITLTALCRRLDNLPLAIELAAARTNAFTLDQLVRSIDLAGGADRTAAPRQQTLRSVAAWSYDLLDEPEQQVFERLSVFRGPCPAKALAAVAAVDGTEAIIGRLVDKSLVVVEPAGRYRMLLTLAGYARERLEERGDVEATRRRHAEHHCELAERGFVDWRTPGGRTQGWWLDELAATEDDLVAALGWAVEHGEAELAQRLGSGLGWYWWHSGQAPFGVRWLERALNTGPSSEAARAGASAWHAWLLFEAGDLAGCAARAEEALPLAVDGGASDLIAMLEVTLAQLAWTDGRIPDAVEHYEASARASLAAGDPWSAGVGSCVRALAESLRGDPDSAEQSARTSIDLFQDVGDTATLVIALGMLAALEERRGDLAAAETSLQRGHELCVTHGLRGSAATMSIRLGALALARRRPDEAVGRYGEAVAVARATAFPRLEAVALDGLAAAHRARGDVDAAAACQDERAALARRHGSGITRPMAPFALV